MRARISSSRSAPRHLRRRRLGPAGRVPADRGRSRGSTSRARRLVAPAGDCPGRLARPDGGALELARVSTATGGRLLGELRSSELSAPRAERPRELLDLRPWALLIALLLFLADVLLRRLPVRRPAAPAAP
ncbi:MAG: hypothetical protein R3F20_06690 [Planctomycetota bacterium]